MHQHKIASLAYALLLAGACLFLGYCVGVNHGTHEVLVTVQEPPPPAPQIQTQEEKGTGIINLNTADQETLELLPGIGPGLAEEIIAYREANGPFQTIADLKQVKGIGEKRFAALEMLITVEG